MKLKSSIKQSPKHFAHAALTSSIYILLACLPRPCSGSKTIWTEKRAQDRPLGLRAPSNNLRTSWPTYCRLPRVLSRSIQKRVSPRAFFRHQSLIHASFKEEIRVSQDSRSIGPPQRSYRRDRKFAGSSESSKELARNWLELKAKHARQSPPKACQVVG